MKKKITTMLLLASAVAILWLGQRTYHVEGSAGWNIVCNKGECYLFIEQGYSGWSVRRYQYAESFVRSMLFSAFRPTHHAPAETLVLRVTATSTNERLFSGSVMPIDTFDGQLYVSVSSVADPCICKWVGIGYEKLSKEERDALRSAEQTGLTNISNNNQGWTKYWLRDTPLKVSLVDGDVIFTLHGYADDRRSISVSQGNQKPERVIWSFDESGHTVSKGEYERIFGAS